MRTEAVPTLDLQTCAPSELAEALMTSSCAFVTGHGVDRDLLARMVEVSNAFFDQPDDAKGRVRWPGTGQWAGWLPVYQGARDLNSSELPELLEKYEIQLPRPWEARDPAGMDAWSEHFAHWPADIDGFRTTWTEYYAALGDLASRIVALLADALDLPADQLEDWTGRHYANLVVNHYLAQVEPPAPGQVRIRQHTDIGGLTVLWADDAPGGLEVRLSGRSEWLPVQVPDGAFLIQAGELLARWTNDRIEANIHRVANPPRHLGPTSRRTSIVYFHYPALDVVVQPAPSCVSATRPAAPRLGAESHLRAAVERPKDRHRRLDDELARR